MFAFYCFVFLLSSHFCISLLDSNPIIIVTGANSGLGKECAKILALSGHSVVLACRNLSNGKEAISDILKENSEAKVELESLDLSNFESIEEFSMKIGKRPVQAIIHNAGILNGKRSVYGYDNVLQVNHYGPFVLTKLLVKNLLKAVDIGIDTRVIMVTSNTHAWGNFDKPYLRGGKSIKSWKGYANSKLYNIMYASEFHKRYNKLGIKSLSVRPGLCRTNITRNNKILHYFYGIFELFLTPVNEGSKAIVHATLGEIMGGAYYNKFKLTMPSCQSQNAKNREELWEISNDAYKKYKETQA